MFDEKELEAKIISFLEKKRYATIPQIAKAVKSDFNTVFSAICKLGSATHTIAQVWSKKLNMRLHYYSLFPLEPMRGDKITKAHKAVQKRWLRHEALNQDRFRQYATLSELLYSVSASLKPEYFLLTQGDALAIYQNIIDALPKP